MQMQERRNLHLQRSLECGGKFLGTPNYFTETTKCAHPCGKVWVNHGGTRRATRILLFLVRYNGSINAVVNDNHERFGFLRDCSGDLLAIHEEIPISADGDNAAFGKDHRTYNCRRYRKPHRPITCAHKRGRYMVTYKSMPPNSSITGTIRKYGFPIQASIQFTENSPQIDPCSIYRIG